jgi:hypothetical protein
LRYPADLTWDLSARLNEKLVDLDELKIHQFEFDYQSGIAYIDIAVETSAVSSSWLRLVTRSYSALLDSLQRFKMPPSANGSARTFEILVNLALQKSVQSSKKPTSELVLL